MAQREEMSYIDNWFYQKIIDPMNNFASKYPYFSLVVSLIALIMSVVGLIIRIMLI